MGWLDLQNEPLIPLTTQKALTTFAVTFHTEIVAFFGLPDVPRPNARAVIDLLHRQGIQVHIVSGDAPPRWSRTSRESWASRACVRSVAAYPQSKLLACAHRALQATGGICHVYWRRDKQHAGTCRCGHRYCHGQRDGCCSKCGGCAPDLARALEALFHLSRSAV
jgi:hypothetical protein